MVIFRVQYYVDIVYVIDVGGSMRSKMSAFREHMLNFDRKAVEALESLPACGAKQVRTRIIEFSDFATDGADAIRGTRFFTMPQDRAEFEKAVGSIECRGEPGIGKPKRNGLEALFAAMRSDWAPLDNSDYENGDRARQIVVYMSDADVFALGESEGAPGYKKSDYPADVYELQRNWEFFERPACMPHLPSPKRLIMFMPHKNICSDLYNVLAWDKAMALDIEEGSDIAVKDSTYQAIQREIIDGIY